MQAGIRGVSHQWFKSYLSDRIAATIVNNNYSTEQKVKVGVPQGSNLGPLLYTVYVNDIKYLEENQDVMLFADDTDIFIFDKQKDQLMDRTNSVLAKLTFLLDGP